MSSFSTVSIRLGYNFYGQSLVEWKYNAAVLGKNFISIHWINKRKAWLRYKSICPCNIWSVPCLMHRENSKFNLLEDHHIHMAIVPANCTGRLQPLDISINKTAKDFLWRSFQDWYADQVCLQIQRQQHQETKSLQLVDLRMNIVKPLGARWMMSLFEYLSTKPEIIKNGFKECGIGQWLNHLICCIILQNTVMYFYLSR